MLVTVQEQAAIQNKPHTGARPKRSTVFNTGFTAKSAQTIVNYQGFLNFESSSISKTYDIDIKKQFNKLRQKMDMTDVQSQVFERIFDSMVKFGYTDKIDFEDSVDGEIVIGRDSPKGLELMIINGYGDVMLSTIGNKRHYNSREIFDIEHLDAETVTHLFLT